MPEAPKAPRAPETPTRRRKTGPGVTGQRLGVLESRLDRKKYAYRWINDDETRLHAKTVEDDWDIITNDGEVASSTDLGSAVSQVVGTHPDGRPKRAYLCRKPRGYFDDDQRTKVREVDEITAHLRRGNDRKGGVQADYVRPGDISITG